MTELFLQNRILIDDKKIELFERYYNLLIEYNQKFNLTAITEKKEVYLKHFVDSVLGGEFISGGNLIDIGSGGGFPALPLKIINGDINLTMLEATGKKCEFLKTVVKELKLDGVKVINGRAEDLAKDSLYREKFDYCTARAVARLNTLTEYCLPFVKKGGSFIAFKGDAEEEIKEAETAVKILGGKIKTIKNYLLGEAKRCLIQIEKISLTDKKYPRGNGKERKNPL